MSLSFNTEQIQSIVTAAKTLAKRRATGKTGALLDKALRPKDIAHAFAIQQVVAQEFLTQNNPIAGWKCLQSSAEKAIVAPIYQQDIYVETQECPLYPSNIGLARVEPELAFEIGTNLPPRSTLYTETEIDATLGKTRLALELIQSRYHTPSEATHFDALADGLANQGLWLGPVLNPLTGLETSHFELSVDIEKNEHNQSKKLHKSAVHPNGFPKAGLYWLVNFLSTQGIGLQQGQYVITGSYAGVLELPFQQNCQFNYGGLGQFTIKFITK